MHLRILNEALCKYGFSKDLEYSDKSFHGHQKGVAICVREHDPKKGESLHVIDNYLPESCPVDKDQALQEILDNHSVIKLCNIAVHIDDITGEASQREIIYIPYYVVDHSCFAPTVNFESIDDFPERDRTGANCEVEVELLFVTQGTNRYITFRDLIVKAKASASRKTSVVECPIDLLDRFFSSFDRLAEAGAKTVITNGEEDGFYLDFYNQAGEQAVHYFDSIKSLKETLVSFRIIDIKEYLYVLPGDKK